MIQIKKGDYTKSQLKEYAASQYELANHCGYEIRNLEQKAFDYMLKDDWDSERAIGQQLTTMKKKKENFEKNVEELRKLHDDEVDSICFLEERDAHTTTDTTDTTRDRQWRLHSFILIAQRLHSKATTSQRSLGTALRVRCSP
jgi:hypothetical protein